MAMDKSDIVVEKNTGLQLVSETRVKEESADQDIYYST